MSGRKSRAFRRGCVRPRVKARVLQYYHLKAFVCAGSGVNGVFGCQRLGMHASPGRQNRRGTTERASTSVVLDPLYSYGIAY